MAKRFPYINVYYASVNFSILFMKTFAHDVSLMYIQACSYNFFRILDSKRSKSKKYSEAW